MRLPYSRMRLPYSLRLKVPHAHPEVYARAVAWIEEHDSNIATTEGAWGVTYLNGAVYVSELGFKHEEDLLVFILKFPELI